jgi:hypothetical protein
VLVVLANRAKQRERLSRKRHQGFGKALKIPLMFLMVAGLSLVTASIQGGGSMIGSFAMNLASHMAIEAVCEQSK